MYSTIEQFPRLSIGDQHSEPAATSKTLESISIERNTFTDKQDKACDNDILRSFRIYLEHNEEPGLDSLLSTITATDTRLTMLNMEKVRKLFEQEPSIKHMLRNAWQTRSFKEVRLLAILWPQHQDIAAAVPKKEYQESRRPLVDNESHLAEIGIYTFRLLSYSSTSFFEALSSAWSDNYNGDKHLLLFSNIQRIRRSGKPYSNQIAIVQSSGTGKSRMVHEQAKLVFTIPFNLRESKDSQDLAFPLADDAVRDYFVTFSVRNSLMLKTMYLKFLGSVFSTVEAELRACRTELENKQIRSGQELAKWWSDHLIDVRQELYEQAIRVTDEKTPISPDMEKMHKELLNKRKGHKSKKKSEDFNAVDYDICELTEFAAAESARIALGQLIDVLDHYPCANPELKLVIYFDEAHTLNRDIPSSGDEKTHYDFLCLCLNRLLAYPIFIIFLSTNSSLAQFATPQALARSARIRGGKAETHAPITEVPFDCYTNLKVVPGKLSIKDISTLSFMAQFGRPLFWSLLRGARIYAFDLNADLISLVRAKLIASRHIDALNHEVDLDARIAVIDLQLSLCYEPLRERVQMLKARLVESHMRIAYSIPYDREYLRSGYPSEPLLAEAAAQQLSVWREQNPVVVVDTLNDALKTGLLDRGELGELTGRQLLLDAYHRAVESEQHQFPPNFSAGCHLTTFIQMLYSDECAEKVLDSKPDNAEGVSFRQAFKDARLCFTHFVKMDDDSGVTSASAWVAFVRHMGIMCRHGQQTVDCILPVLLWDVKLCEHVITAILIQFKRRQQSGTIAKYSIDQAEINFFPKMLEKCTHGSVGVTSYRPYISLIMELGVQHAPRESLSNSKMHIPQYGQKHHPVKADEAHARYNIFTYSCSSTVYQGINAEQEAKYALLLRSRDFVGEHPRGDRESISALRQLKPFWIRGVDCYHWVDYDPVLHGSLEPQEDDCNQE